MDHSREQTGLDCHLVESALQHEPLIHLLEGQPGQPQKLLLSCPELQQKGNLVHLQDLWLCNWEEQGDSGLEVGTHLNEFLLPIGSKTQPETAGREANLTPVDLQYHVQQQPAALDCPFGFFQKGRRGPACGHIGERFNFPQRRMDVELFVKLLI